MSLIFDTWFQFAKYMKITLRMPLWTLFGLIQPLIWLVIFGELFRNMTQLGGFPATSYIEFLTPGILVMTVLFGSSWSGVSLLREINFGTVNKVLVTPVKRTSIVLSRVLHSAVTVIIQIIIIFTLAWFLGAKVHGGLAAFTTVTLLILLLAVGFAALSNGFAMKLKREEPLVVIGNMLTLPLMFFSSAFIPQSFMPDWIKNLAVLNPVSYAVDAVRLSLNGEFTVPFLFSFFAVFFFAVLTMVWATRMFIRQQED
ncbi:MAG: ABC transporter permease [Nitrospirae bacterium]|nr:ABC transporter permease [Nitrospirota bacterium]MBI3351726.1 ABC transporter permease [Nitrospirota bacterium]